MPGRTRWQRSRRRITKAATSPHRATSDSPRSATSPTPHAGGAGPSLERGGVCSTHPRSIRLRRARALEQVGHLATQKSPTKSGLLNANPSRTSGRSPLLLRWRAFALRPHPGLLRTGFDLAREPPMRVHLFAPRERASRSFSCCRCSERRGSLGIKSYKPFYFHSIIEGQWRGRDQNKGR
jgi:hypothetical protein